MVLRVYFLIKKDILHFIRRPRILYMTVIVRKAQNMCIDFVWAWVIYESINSNTFFDTICAHFFKIRLILYVTGYEVESTVHFFLHYPLFISERSTLPLRNLDSKLIEHTDSLMRNICFSVNSLSVSSEYCNSYLMQPWNLFYQLRDLMKLIRLIFISFYFIFSNLCNCRYPLKILIPGECIM